MQVVDEDEKITITFTVNEIQRMVTTEPGARLLDVLRDQLHLTGTKEGCGVGECGACTVIMNGDAVNACLVTAIQLEGSRVTTIEGLVKDGEMDPLQKSFIDQNAISCGFCTPGAIMSARALLNKNPKPTDEEIRVAMSGNLCRCTGYENFLRAIQFVRDSAFVDDSWRQL